MKKIFSTILIGLFAIHACDKDNLSLSNPNELTPDTYFTSDAQLTASVNAIYTNLQSRGYYARRYFFTNDLMSQECFGLGSLAADLRQYIDHSFDPSNPGFQFFWENSFQGIAQANFVINNQENFENMTEAVVNKRLGEAHYLRAHYYFELVSRFGDVPLLVEIVTSPEGLPRTASEEIYQFILSDLTEAIRLLPEKDVADAANLGRATRGTAQALKGMVHLFREEYTEASTEFQNVINGPYSLVDDFNDNFEEESEHNDESIFEIQFNSAWGGSGAWSINGTGVAEVTFRGQEYGFSAWRNVIPSQELLEEFESDDPRLGYTFYAPGDTYGSNNEFTVEAFVTIPDDLPSWRKYQRYYKQENEDTNSGVNFRFMRLANVILMQAEALAMSNNLPGAVDLLNQIRSRPSVNMPLYGTAEMDSRGYPVSTQEQVINAIRHEKMVELAGEQVRYRDIIRWGMGPDVIPNFQTGKHELWPIPQTEIDANPEMTNNDQNPGY
ncbi:RagB/SusD family nutrient uptake outer membrane protein [Fulvivirgaceae bacterium BMA12]|uniref:RagB/SusD family nutrient uptake outer membrane protein n=1 Tax=Agaribacillus aureus TaxID=3051825 RepID=A0ABT8L103_9BACT|nr:RagB/SusD family nutrient uptake outer membrane protein [Fulvivirgaceae bacterium BMA12]